ncbi:hypothetical protein VP01_663g9 [Puccinia sorghi]|uniref:Uncharacterized protein n=1 Tax=Puccinia sorghi TaxID=27349 RepID=A0A0L6UFW2_9BASI|nr:hypothetical protein VP01_663g9 [Puccinia sorghi]
MKFTFQMSIESGRLKEATRWIRGRSFEGHSSRWDGRPMRARRRREDGKRSRSKEQSRRSNALDTIRGIEDLADFFLGDDENGAESEGKYDDAEDENEAPLRTAVNEPSQADPVTRPPSKPSKYRRFRDRCMRAEFLDLSQGLPAAFEHDWIMVGPVPKGKRCLALSLNETSRPSCGALTSTVLLSRKNADQIGEFSTPLPSNCIVDCHDRLRSYVCYQFRFWWRDAKLSELAPQPRPNSTTLVCASIPARAHFSKAQVWDTAEKMSTSSSIASIQVITQSGRDNIYTDAQSLNISYQCDGLLFYLKEATYQSGESLLAGWVPLLPPQDQNSNLHGISHLVRLCQTSEDKQQDHHMQI